MDNKLTKRALAYEFMLELINQTNHNEELGIAAMSVKGIFEEASEQWGLMPTDFSWDEFSIEIVHLDDNHPAIVYTFPSPTNVPEAKYGAIVMNKKKNNIIYFTLEKTIHPGRWALGQNTPKEHFQVGLFDIEPSKEKFLDLIMGAAQLYFEGDVNAVIKMPSDYQLVKSMPEDPNHCLNYMKQTPNSIGFVQLFPLALQSAMEFGDEQVLIDGIHRTLAENQALIEVGSGKKGGDYHYIYSIIKTRREPSGVNYYLLLDVHYGEAVLRVKAFFDESGMTGQRDVMVFELMRREGKVVINDDGAITGWMKDPYDANISKSYLMNLSEDKRFDPLFPDHPLSQCRTLLQHLVS
ncbi:MAG: hypothetical protein J5784_05100 [Muribaculaceae bacterium]|nr:hypothetical protein [Muribaculaceae bacterium]